MQISNAGPVQSPAQAAPTSRGADAGQDAASAPSKPAASGASAQAERAQQAAIGADGVQTKDGPKAMSSTEAVAKARKAIDKALEAADGALGTADGALGAADAGLGMAKGLVPGADKLQASIQAAEGLVEKAQGMVDQAQDLVDKAKPMAFSEQEKAELEQAARTLEKLAGADGVWDGEDVKRNASQVLSDGREVGDEKPKFHPLRRSVERMLNNAQGEAGIGTAEDAASRPTTAAGEAAGRKPISRDEMDQFSHAMALVKSKSAAKGEGISASFPNGMPVQFVHDVANPQGPIIPAGVVLGFGGQ